MPKFDTNRYIGMSINEAIPDLIDRILVEVRAIVREEIRAALQEEEDAEEVRITSRLVRIEGAPTGHVEIEHEGVRYAGEVYPVKREE